MNIERKNMLLMALFPYAAGGHRSTHYDECVCKAGKDRARFYIQGAVSLVMKEFKGN